MALPQETQEYIKRRYVDEGLSISDLHKDTMIPLSTIRWCLLRFGVLRTPKEAGILAGKQGKKGAHNIGRTRVVTDETRRRMREGWAKWSEKNAAGVSFKTGGYAECTIGVNKFRGLHRVVMEQHLGRKLSKHEFVHHKDGNKHNNAIENLEIMTPQEHSRLHVLQRHAMSKSKKPQEN